MKIVSQLIPKLVALTLVLWLAGFACVLCCEPFETPEKDSCPMAGHSCCKKKSDNKDAISASVTGGDIRMSCCKYSTPYAEPARRIGFSTERPELAEALEFSKPAFFAQTVRRVYPTEYRPPIHDRGGTFVKNCVFRI